MWWRNWQWWMFGAGLAMVALVMYSDHTLNGDEGVVLNAAWQIWHGKQLYIDFADFTAPGSAYSIYWVWTMVGGPSYLSAKLFSLVMLGAATFCLSHLIYQTTRNYYLTCLTAVSWVILARFYPIINHNTYSSFVAAITLICLWQTLITTSANKRYWWAGLTGITSALVLWYLHTKGLAIILACLVSLLAYKKYYQTIICSFSAVLTLTVLLWPWSLAELWYSWVELPLQSQYLAYTIIWWPVLVLEIGLIIAMAYSSRRWSIKWGYLLTWWQVALWASAGYLIDVNHLFINSFPSLLLILLWLHKLSGQKVYPPATKLLHGLVLSLPILVFSIFNLVSGNNIFTLDILHRPNQSWQNFLALGERANSIYAGPFLPSVYFELRKPNPFTAANNMVLCNATCQAETVATFQQVQPDYAIVNYALVEKYHYQASQPIDRYIQQHYSLCHTPSLSGMQVYSSVYCNL